MEHIASMVMPEVKALHPEWIRFLPGEAHRSQRRLPGMSNVMTFNLELKSHQTHGTEPT